MKKSLLLLVALLSGLSSVATETLPPLRNGEVPRTLEELWAGFDPRAEPLDVEVLKEWEEDGVVLKVLRYRIGVFKGQKAMMAAVYGYPKGGTNLPGLVQIHGGGQYADYRAPLTNAKRGYATVSISWAGRINAPGYNVSPSEVELFWADDTDNPDYKLITDWGALDAYHAPTRRGVGGFGGTKPNEWTLDAVESPRNDPWFLCTLGARRALTFLERQAEVDADRLGVYGHSMGGKITVLTTGSDSRVKASVPSCGGVSGRPSAGATAFSLTGDNDSLERIACPILFQSPSNDFHGRIDDLQTALGEIQSDEWRMSVSPHHNHQDTPQFEVTSQLWFDQYLKGTFEFPETPVMKVDISRRDGVPTASVSVDTSRAIESVDVYYTQHGQVDGLKDNSDNTKNRFWHSAATAKKGGKWKASLPLASTDRPFWAYANVTYKLEEPVTRAGYYYSVHSSDVFTISSRMFTATANELKNAKVRPSLKPSLVIETFEGDWEKEWFTYEPEKWGRKTHKIYSEIWKGPTGAKLAVEVRVENPNTLVVGMDGYVTEVKLSGGAEWQRVVLSPSDFQDSSGSRLADWEGLRELRLVATDKLKERVDGEMKSKNFGGPWDGAGPEFRNLRWIE